MSRCGSIFEEMLRQLLATGRWREVRVRQRPIVKVLFVPELQRDLSDVTVHLMLGDKTPMENLIAQRRLLVSRQKARSSITPGTPSTARLGLTRALRLPMGGEGGEVRVVDFIEGTRCITLKSKMVSTLLRHHQGSWEKLGQYLPLTFRIDLSGGPKDERDLLLEAATNKKLWQGGKPPLWIAKSSSGSHGDNIEIFKGDRAGVNQLLKYVESKKGNIWVAQQYIDRPLLYHKRKFDIRCFALLLRDSYEVYVHQDIIMRTSSVPYSRDTATSKGGEGRLAHITNHCVQSEGASYSMYEEGNELWREHLDGLVRYKGNRMLKNGTHRLDKNRRLVPCGNTIVSTSAARGTVRSSPVSSPSPPRYPQHSDDGATARGADVTVHNHIMPQIHYIVKETICAARPHLPVEPCVPSPTQCFQVFGYDFLIDEDLKVWLLEINGAPGGADRIVPRIMKDTIELCVSPFFPLSKEVKSEPSGYVKVYPLGDLDTLE
ncbi:tubulin---tyrosine ligase [Angomonas deanei]|nr:tubulin---tyrosine ligase [Angomonas deanei]|eukprot:EPY39442.1 tubulin---tyrosine ligase [Angomonas deanei]